MNILRIIYNYLKINFKRFDFTPITSKTDIVFYNIIMLTHELDSSTYFHKNKFIIKTEELYMPLFFCNIFISFTQDFFPNKKVYCNNNLRVIMQLHKVM